jgi:hypothetical protein
LKAVVLLATPVRFALKRMRERRLPLVIIVIALAGAAGLIGWGGLAASLAQESNVRQTLRELPPPARALRVVHYTSPQAKDANAVVVANELRAFGDVTTRTRHVQVWHSIAPEDARGIRIVFARGQVFAEQGRLPRGCNDGVCEALALRGSYRRGQLLHLHDTLYTPRGRARRIDALIRIVGLGSLRSDALSDSSELGAHALFMRGLTKPLRKLVLNAGSSVFWTAPLDPDKVHAFRIRGLSERLRRAVVRIDRDTDPNNPAQATAPLGRLNALADRGDTARSRLLLVAGEAAALIVAFAAFAANSRRRDTAVGDEQLATFGATRVQAWLMRSTEALLPCVIGIAIALIGLRVATELVARARSLPGGFVASALPTSTILVVIAVGLAAALLLVLSAAPRRARYGVGAIELAALASLGLVAWQVSATGALDPARVASSGGNPVVVMMPALAFFASGVVLLRVLPLLLRLGERFARRGPFAVRLAFVTAARNPTQAAAATTFLAVALGGALFSLNYRATLVRQAHDQADFAAGAAWRVIERNPRRTYGPTDVTPLTRFARISRENPTPVIRIGAELPNVNPQLNPRPVQLVGIPAARLSEVRGWRSSFSSLDRNEIARRLRLRPVRLHGASITRDADEIRMWVRTKTEAPRIVVLHFLLPGQRFEFLRLGLAHKRWRLLHGRLPLEMRGSELVGLEFLPTVVPLTHPLDYNGEIDVGAISLRRKSEWAVLRSVNEWVAARPFVGSSSGVVVPSGFISAQIGSGLQFYLLGTLRPLIRPSIQLPENLPALVGGDIATAAVNEKINLNIADRTLSIRVAGQSSLFPTVTKHPEQFAIVDYDTLFALLNADQPGTAVPSEAWFFDGHGSGFVERLHRPPFRLEQAIAAKPLATRLLADPLAAGTRSVLFVAGLAAAAFGLLGLILSTRATLAAERLLIAEYEALGVPTQTLSRAAQLRFVALSAVGIGAAFAGGLLAVRLIGSFVAVTGTGTSPLPPIVPSIAWVGALVVLSAVALIGISAVALLVKGAFRESTAMRLRA